MKRRDLVKALKRVKLSLDLDLEDREYGHGHALDAAAEVEELLRALERERVAERKKEPSP